MISTALLAQTTYTTNNGSEAAWVIIAIIVVIVGIVATWRVYEKAGKPGWAAIIPFYNIYVLLKIIGRPGWWLVLYFIPLVNVVVHIVVAIELAKTFRKSTVFGVLWLWLVSFVGYLILGFGNAKYSGVPKR